MNNNNSEKKDTHSYKGWLNSDSFIKRCMAVVGYNIIGTLFIQLGLLLLIVVFYIVVGAMLGYSF